MMASSAGGDYLINQNEVSSLTDNSRQDFEYPRAPDSADQIRSRDAGWEKLPKRVQFADQHQGGSEDDRRRSERFHSLSPSLNRQQQRRSNYDHDEDYENYRTVGSSYMRSPHEIEPIMAQESRYSSVFADHIPSLFEIVITADEVDNFSKSDLKKSNTIPNMHNDNMFARQLEKRHILTSWRSLSDEGQESIEMWHTEDTPTGSFTHWRHIKRQFMDLEEFTKLASQTPHINKSVMMSILVQKFMEKVKKKFSESPRQGERTLHGVLRCDAQGEQDGVVVNVTATWLCFPYLSKGDNYKDGISLKASKGLYRTRTLFQWSYENEPASERDERQAFKTETKELLYVPQVWILLLGKDTIITSSPCSLKQLLPGIVKLQPVPPEPPKLRWIKLIGPHHRENIIPATDCETFCALSISVAEICFDGKNWEHMFDLFINNHRLTADLWLYFIASGNFPTLEVWIKVKQDDSDRDTTLISTQGSDSDEDSYAEIDRSESDAEYPAKSAWIYSHARGTSSETPGVSEIHNEGTQSAHTRHENGKQRDVVVRAPKDRPEEEIPELKMPERERPDTENITQNALSQVLPFLEWDLKRNDSVIDLSSQAIKEKDAKFYLLTQIHGSLKDPGYHFPAIEDVPPELRSEYLESSLYAKAPMEDFEEIESLEESERHEQNDSMDSPLHVSNTDIEGSQQGLAGSLIKRQLKEGRQDDRSAIILQTIQSTKRLISFFVNCSERHFLLSKTWGALKTLVVTTANPNLKHRYELMKMENWIVLGSPHAILKMQSIYEIPNPDRHPHDVCEPCKNGNVYASMEEAFFHLVREHYYMTELTEKTTKALSSLLQSVEEVWMTQVRQAHYALLKVVLKRMENLRKVTQKVKIGLAQNNKDSAPAYTLPQSLVQVLEYLVGFILVCAHTARLIDSAYATWVPNESDNHEILKVDGYIDFVDEFGKGTEEVLSKACDDIYSMVRKNMASSLKVRESVGTRYMTVNMLRHLLVQPLVGDQSIVELYVDILSRLESSVFHDRPRRRLFSSIHLLKQDINALINVRLTQRSVLQDLCTAFDPATFHRNNEPREAYQCQSSIPLLDSALEAALGDIKEFHLILRQSSNLEREAKHRIDILEEDHGKAIFVFSLVTAIFLPLSFVTSYMGMNTADIRDMRATQERFWTIAIPLTVMVMVTATLLAYKGHVVQAWLLSIPKWLTKDETGMVEVSHERQNIGPVIGEKLAVMGLFRGAKRRRRDGGKGLDQGNQSPV